MHACSDCPRLLNARKLHSTSACRHRRRRCLPTDRTRPTPRPAPQAAPPFPASPPRCRTAPLWLTTRPCCTIPLTTPPCTTCSRARQSSTPETRTSSGAASGLCGGEAEVGGGGGGEARGANCIVFSSSIHKDERHGGLPKPAGRDGCPGSMEYLDSTADADSPPRRASLPQVHNMQA